MSDDLFDLIGSERRYWICNRQIGVGGQPCYAVVGNSDEDKVSTECKNCRRKFTRCYCGHGSSCDPSTCVLDTCPRLKND